MFPNLTGTIEVVELGAGMVSVRADLHSAPVNAQTELEKLVYELYPNKLVSFDVTVNKLTVMSNEGSITNAPKAGVLDELDIIYYGKMKTKDISPNEKFKIVNENITKPVDNVVRVLNFIAPIVLDSNLKVIDGNLRLAIAKNNDIDEVLVVVVNDAGKKADFLRMALNRSSEFQRWNYEDTDNYVDTTPQAQPLFEPLGFFGKLVLPVSYFANTVVQYELDPYNDQQKLYRQEVGIAEWAKIQRERQAKIEEQKKLKKVKKPVNAVSLFSLAPTEEDFLETYDIHSELRQHEVEMREVAGTITENYDEVRKAELEAKGRNWQGSRRTSTQKAADKRAEVEGVVEEEVEETFIPTVEVETPIAITPTRSRRDRRNRAAQEETEEETEENDTSYINQFFQD